VKSKKEKVKRRKEKVVEENELSKRLFKFSVDIIRMLRTLNTGIENRIIINQLGKSATSAGANYEESQAAVSRADFGNKIGISLKEMRESNYWLRILKELYPRDSEIDRLTTESQELKNILGTISHKVSPRK